MNPYMMPDPDGALGWNERPDDLFSFLGKIHRKEWSSRCLGSVPGNSFPGNKHSHPPPLPTDSGFSFTLQHNSFFWTSSGEEAVTYKRCWPRYGQAIEDTARVWQARSRTGDKYRVSSTQGTGSRGAWSRRQKPAWVSSGTARQCV